MNDSEQIAFHPMQNDATSAISNADMKKVIALSGHEAETIDFSKFVSEDAKAGEEKKAAFCSNATSKIENCKQEMLLLRSKSAAEDLDF
jgi:hypothetical protein